MATYVNDLRLKEIATGDESGTWGTSTNTNLELIAEAFSFGTEAITTNADTHTTTIADGSTDPGRSIYLKYTGTLDSACTITIGPNTVSKLWFIENGTSGSQNIIISQGSGANVTIPAGEVKAVYSDGAGSGAAIVDAFAGLKVSDAAQTNITSVGTLSSLTVSGDLTVDTSTLKVDSSNNRVGIANSSPDVTLDVGGNGRFDSVSGNALRLDRVTSGNNIDIDFHNPIGTAGVIAKIRVDGDGLSNTFGAISFQTATTPDSTSEAMRINRSGDVGIGTASPSAPLDVDGNFIFKSPANTLYGNFDATTQSFAAFRLQAAGSSYGFIGQTSSLLASGGSNTALGVRSENEFVIATGGSTERMRIDSSGNVGVGNSSPTRNLTVGDTAASSAINIKSSAVNGFSILALGDSGDDNYAQMFLDNSTNKLQIQNGGGGVLGDRGITLDSSENVGIGVSSPSAALDVAGLTSVNSGNNSGVALKIGGEGGNGLKTQYIVTGSSHTNFQIGVATHAASVFSITPSTSAGGTTFTNAALNIDSSGNVGIGTSSPSYRLHLVADDGILAAFTNNSDADFLFKTASAVAMITPTTGTLAFGTSNTERMRIDASGNLLVGTTTVTSAAKLQLTSSNTFFGFVDRAQVSTGNPAGFFNQAGSEVGNISTTSSGTTFNSASDYRLKENVDYTWDATTRLKQLKPARFNFIADETNTLVDGFLAHEVSSVVPEAITGEKDGNRMQSIDQSKLVPLLVKTIQELEARITALES